MMPDEQSDEDMGPPLNMVYRTPVSLPFELTEHTGIFFEERLCPSSLSRENPHHG